VRATRRTIDLVVSDIVMPRLTELELGRANSRGSSRDEVFIYNGLGDQFPNCANGIKYGVNILEKPFLPSELLGKWKKTLNPGDSSHRLPRISRSTFRFA